MQWLIDIIREWIEAQDYATETWVTDWFTPLSVTGRLNPNATCLYFKAGTHNDQPYYKRSDGAWFIWWDGGASWVISQTPGVLPPVSWFRVDTNVEGTYLEGGGASGTPTVAFGHRSLCTSFINRGDPAAADLTLPGMTADGNWHDWDLSGIIAEDAKSVLLELWITNSISQKTLSIREKGNANNFNVKYLTTQVANVSIQGEATVPLPATKIIEYKMPAGGWTGIFLTVKGWWL